MLDGANMPVAIVFAWESLPTERTEELRLLDMDRFAVSVEVRRFLGLIVAVCTLVPDNILAMLTSIVASVVYW